MVQSALLNLPRKLVQWELAYAPAHPTYSPHLVHQEKPWKSERIAYLILHPLPIKSLEYPFSKPSNYHILLLLTDSLISIILCSLWAESLVPLPVCTLTIRFAIKGTPTPCASLEIFQARELFTSGLDALFKVRMLVRPFQETEKWETDIKVPADCFARNHGSPLARLLEITLHLEEPAKIVTGTSSIEVILFCRAKWSVFSQRYSPKGAKNWPLRINSASSRFSVLGPAVRCEHTTLPIRSWSERLKLSAQVHPSAWTSELRGGFFLQLRSRHVPRLEEQHCWSPLPWIHGSCSSTPL